MKNILFTIFFLLNSIFVFNGCSTMEPAGNFAKNYPTAPTWVFNQDYADELYGYSSVGYAQQNTYNYELQLRQAEERSVFLLTSTIEERIKQYVVRSLLHQGIGGRSEIEAFASTIAKRAKILGIKNITLRAQWFAPNKDVFVISSITSDEFISFVDEEIETEASRIKNELAIKAESIRLVKP